MYPLTTKTARTAPSADPSSCARSALNRGGTAPSTTDLTTTRSSVQRRAEDKFQNRLAEETLGTECRIDMPRVPWQEEALHLKQVVEEHAQQAQKTEEQRQKAEEEARRLKQELDSMRSELHASQAQLGASQQKLKESERKIRTAHGPAYIDSDFPAKEEIKRRSETFREIFKDFIIDHLDILEDQSEQNCRDVAAAVRSLLHFKSKQIDRKLDELKSRLKQSLENGVESAIDPRQKPRKFGDEFRKRLGTDVDVFILRSCREFYKAFLLVEPLTSAHDFLGKEMQGCSLWSHKNSGWRRSFADALNRLVKPLVELYAVVKLSPSPLIFDASDISLDASEVTPKRNFDGDEHETLDSQIEADASFYVILPALRAADGAVLTKAFVIEPRANGNDTDTDEGYDTDPDANYQECADVHMISPSAHRQSPPSMYGDYHGVAPPPLQASAARAPSEEHSVHFSQNHQSTHSSQLLHNRGVAQAHQIASPLAAACMLVHDYQPTNHGHLTCEAYGAKHQDAPEICRTQHLPTGHATQVAAPAVVAVTSHSLSAYNQRQERGQQLDHRPQPPKQQVTSSWGITFSMF